MGQLRDVVLAKSHYIQSNQITNVIVSNQYNVMNAILNLLHQLKNSREDTDFDIPLSSVPIHSLRLVANGSIFLLLVYEKPALTM